MLYGSVTYRLKANPDNNVYVPWAGRVVFMPRKDGDGVKMQFYQVYLVRILSKQISEQDVVAMDEEPGNSYVSLIFGVRLMLNRIPLHSLVRSSLRLIDRMTLYLQWHFMYESHRVLVII